MIFKKAFALFLLSFIVFFLFGFFEKAEAAIGDPCPTLQNEEVCPGVNGGVCLDGTCQNVFYSRVGDACVPTASQPEGTKCLDGSLCYGNFCKEVCTKPYGDLCNSNDLSKGRCYPVKSGISVCETQDSKVLGSPCGTDSGSSCKLKAFNDKTEIGECPPLFSPDMTGRQCTIGDSGSLMCCKEKTSSTCPDLIYGEACPLSGGLGDSFAGYCYNGICEKEEGELGEPCGTLGGKCVSITDTSGYHDTSGGRDCNGLGLWCSVLNGELPSYTCKNKADGAECGFKGFCYDEECKIIAGELGEKCGIREGATCVAGVKEDGMVWDSLVCPKGSIKDADGRSCNENLQADKFDDLLCCVSSESSDPTTNPPKNNPADLSDLYPKHVFCTDPQLEEGTTAGFQLFKGSIVPCGRSCDDKKTDNIDEMDECTLCHFILMGKRIYDFVLSLLIIVSLFTITIGGILYMISGANPSLNSTAKEIIKKTLFGFALFLGSWLIVFTVLTLLSANTSLIGKGGDKWFEFSCDTKSAFSLDGKEIDGGDDDGGGEGETVSPLKFANAAEGAIQIQDASSKLNEFMLCISNTSIASLPADARILSSISDSDDNDYNNNGNKVESLMNFCTTSYQKPPCEHAENSCHYGGTTSCKGKSYALDFANEQYFSQISNAAKACNPGAYVLKEGDHVHISIGSVSGCSCN